MIRALDRWWLAPMPARRLATLRILVGAFALVYVVARFGDIVSVARFAPASFRPIGVVSLLTHPLPPPAVYAIAALCAAAGAGFVLGWRYRAVGPLFAALLLWSLTYRSSWGMIFHTENLLVVHVGILAISPAADALSLDARMRPPGDDTRYGWPIRLLGLAVVTTYVLAGIAKLRFGGVGWIDGEVLRNYVATDNLRKILLGSSHSPIAVPLVSHPSAFAGLALLTLAIELGAPLALLGSRAAAVWAVLAIGFHWGVLALMLIVFPYPLIGVAFACFFRAERLTTWRRASAGAAPGPC